MICNKNAIKTISITIVFSQIRLAEGAVLDELIFGVRQCQQTFSTKMVTKHAMLRKGCRS